MRAVPLLALLTACGPTTPPPGGTSVGNPGKTELRLAPPTGVTVESAVATDVLVDVLGCAGGRASLWAEDSLDLVVGDGVAVPGGSWCGLTASVGALDVTGAVESVPVEVTVELPQVLTLWSAEPVVIDETELVLELGGPGWLAAEQIPLEGDLGGVVGPESELAPLLQQRIALGTGWYLDDGDGALEEAERADGTLASTAWVPPAAYGADSGVELDPVSVEGCGNCATGGARPGWLAIVGLALVRRRARRSGR